MRRKDPLKGAETTEIFVRLGNYSASHFEGSAHSLACVAIEFKRGATRVQELIPVENIQRLREYLHAHPELRTATGKGA